MTENIFNFDFLAEVLQKNKSDWFDDKLQKFIRINITRDVEALFNKRIIYYSDTLYIWNDYYYDPRGDYIIKRVLQNAESKLSDRMIDEVIKQIKNTYIKFLEEISKITLPKNYIPLKNGLFNMNTMQLEKHNPDYFYTFNYSITYDPSAFPFYYIWYLLRRFPNNFKEFFKVLETFGYMFLRDNRFQIIPVFLGISNQEGFVSGSEGKTTAIDMHIPLLESTDNNNVNENDQQRPSLIDRTSLKELSESTFNFYNLQGKILHIISLDEATNIYGFESVIERLRDPVISSPKKFAKRGVQFQNTALHILVGNTLPKNRQRTIAFFRSVKMIIHFQEPIKNDWKFKNFIDEKEKSGMFNLLITIAKIETIRNTLYGLLNLKDTERLWKEASDSFDSFLEKIFIKKEGNKLDHDEVKSYVENLAENSNLVMNESISEKFLTRHIHEVFNIQSQKTHENKDGNTITKKYYIGIDYKFDKTKVLNGEITDPDFEEGKEKNNKIETENWNLRNSFLNVLQNYVLTIPKNLCSNVPIISLLHSHNNNNNEKENIEKNQNIGTQSLKNILNTNCSFGQIILNTIGTCLPENISNTNFNLDSEGEKNKIGTFLFDILMNADATIFEDIYQKYGHEITKISSEELYNYLKNKIKLPEIEEQKVENPNINKVEEKIQEKAKNILHLIKHKQKMLEDPQKYEVDRTKNNIDRVLLFEFDIKNEKQREEIIQLWIDSKMVILNEKDELIYIDDRKNDKINVRILEDIGEIGDIDRKYNLSKEDIVSLSEDLANLLIIQGKAEKIEGQEND